MAKKKTPDFITDTDMRQSLDGNELTERAWVNVKFIPDLIWVENPKSHDVGAIMQVIQDVGFKDMPRFNANLPNVAGGEGAFVYGNGRATALYQMWESGDYDLPQNIVEIEGDWYMPIDVGLDEDLATARAFGIDHNILPLSGGNYGVEGMFSIFDQQKLAQVWESATQGGRQLATMDAIDLTALHKYLEEPMFDVGNAPKDKSVNVGDTASQSPELPPSAIRQVQLFFDTDTIEEFSALATELRERFEIHTLSDLMLHIMRKVAQE